MSDEILAAIDLLTLELGYVTDGEGEPIEDEATIHFREDVDDTCEIRISSPGAHTIASKIVETWNARTGGAAQGVQEPDLDTPYIPTLVKFDDPPRLEYVTKDCASIYNPVDERFCYITDMETRKIIGFQFMLPRGPQPIPHTSERREFSLEGTGFTLRECGCTEGFCEGRTDGTCTVPSTVRHTHACLTCCGDGYINVHANLPDVKCPDCGGTGRGPADDPSTTSVTSTHRAGGET